MTTLKEIARNKVVVHLLQRIAVRNSIPSLPEIVALRAAAEKMAAATGADLLDFLKDVEGCNVAERMLVAISAGKVGA